MAVPERIGKAGPAAFIGVCLVVAALLLARHGSSTKTANATPAVPTIPTDTSSQAPRSGSPTTPPKGGKAPAGRLSVSDTLLTKLDLFIGAYYNITPDDTARTRAARMPSFVHGRLNLGTDAHSLGLNAQGQAMRTNKLEPLTIHGYLIPGKVRGTADPHHANVEHVSGVAETSFNLSDGSVYTVNGQTATSETAFTSTWVHRKNGQWVLVQFSEIGGGT